MDAQACSKAGEVRWGGLGGGRRENASRESHEALMCALLLWTALPGGVQFHDSSNPFMQQRQSCAVCAELSCAGWAVSVACCRSHRPSRCVPRNLEEDWSSRVCHLARHQMWQLKQTTQALHVQGRHSICALPPAPSASRSHCWHGPVVHRAQLCSIRTNSSNQPRSQTRHSR